MQNIYKFFAIIIFSIKFSFAYSQSSPNILLIAVDDMNNYLGCLGGPAITPNIDALAQNGRLFSNAYCASPACNPSRAAILTGYRPETTGQYTNSGNFRNRANNVSIVTLPQKMMQAGYNTIAAGKIFHLPRGNSKDSVSTLSDPQSWNFQQIGEVGTPSNKDYLTANNVAKWLAEDTLKFNAENYLAKASIWGAIKEKKEECGDWKMSQYCADFLKKEQTKPFFLALGISRPHQPLLAPKEYFDKYPLNTITLPEWLETDMDDIPASAQSNFSTDFVGLIKKKNQLRLAYQAYLASMSFADECIGNALKALSEGPNTNNTIVILFSDHGFQLGQKKRWEKYSLWRLATNAPLIIQYPNMRNKGVTCNIPVSLMDIHPTILQLTGITPEENLECESLVSLLGDPYAERYNPAVITHEEGNNSVIFEKWNYIKYKNGEQELYNHETDIQEKINLAKNIDNEQIILSLQKFIPKVKIKQTP